MPHYSTDEKRSQAEWECKYLSVTMQGKNVVDVVRMSFAPACHIKRITKDLYLKGRYDREGNFLTDGKVHSVAVKEGAMRNRRSLRKIFKDLRQLIAANFEGGAKELFVTLTYADQTHDPQQIHADYKAFWKRLQRAYSSYGLGYISVVEPHASGEFHIHALIRATTADHLYIPNEIMSKIWGHGFTTTERLEDIDHMGAYVIAYMSNAEIPPEYEAEYAKYGDIVEKGGKKYIKGKRLDYYPDGMQIARHSRDIVKPTKLTGSAAIGALDLLNAAGGKVYDNTKQIDQTDDEGNVRSAYVQTEQYKTDLPW